MKKYTTILVNRECKSILPQSEWQSLRKWWMLMKMWTKLNPILCWWKYKLVQSLWKFLKNWKSIDNMVHLYCCIFYPGELQVHLSQRYLCTMVIPALFTIVKLWNDLKCPAAKDWVKKKMPYTCTVEFFTIKRTKLHCLQRSGFDWR